MELAAAAVGSSSHGGSGGGGGSHSHHGRGDMGVQALMGMGNWGSFKNKWMVVLQLNWG